MKLLGSVLILWSAGICCFLHQRESRCFLGLGEALLEDLAVLKLRACAASVPLPQILQRDLSAGAAADRLWQPFGRLLQSGGGSAACWHLAVEQLPAPLDRLLLPLGPMLSRGGEPLERAINETREEIAGFLRAERQRRAAADRLAAALYLSGAGLAVLILI